MKFRAVVLLVSLGTSLNILTSCANLPGPGTPRELTDPARFLAGIPLPNSSRVDLERSLILGNSADWTGRVNGDSGLSEEELVRHFSEQLPKAGWRLVTISRSRASLLTLIQGQRVASIEVSPGGLSGGSSFSIVVSPQAQAAPSPPPAR